MKSPYKITVTQPFLPPMEEFIPYLRSIWDSKWLTNNGTFHQQLEKELADYLGVKYLSLFNNGTVALMVALKVLGITGEVITTPFSFVATANAIVWNNCNPIFCDIDPKTMNLDPDKIEDLVTEKATAIMPVHVYGYPCDNEKIKQIAKKHNLKIIYDAAHAFGVTKNGKSILNWGDISVLSFHATKVFNTIEGGAIVCKNKKIKQKVDRLKNFGFAGETSVVSVGINGKMNELQSAFGLLQLKYIEKNIRKREIISKLYSKNLKYIDGIRTPYRLANITYNYSYYPILVDDTKYGLTRDELYAILKEKGIFGRRYFYPLISNFSTYCGLDSSSTEKLPIANKIAEQILCLPIYPDLSEKDVRLICSIIHGYAK